MFAFKKKKPTVATSTLDKFRAMLNEATAAVMGSTPLYFGVIDDKNELQTEIFCVDRINYTTAPFGSYVEVYVRQLSKDADKDSGKNRES